MLGRKLSAQYVFVKGNQSPFLVTILILFIIDVISETAFIHNSTSVLTSLVRSIINVCQMFKQKLTTCLITEFCKVRSQPCFES